jgi:hypothetical protein
MILSQMNVTSQSVYPEPSQPASHELPSATTPTPTYPEARVICRRTNPINTDSIEQSSRQLREVELKGPGRVTTPEPARRTATLKVTVTD